MTQCALPLFARMSAIHKMQNSKMIQMKRATNDLQSLKSRDTTISLNTILNWYFAKWLCKTNGYCVAAAPEAGSSFVHAESDMTYNITCHNSWQNECTKNSDIHGNDLLTSCQFG